MDKRISINFLSQKAHEEGMTTDKSTVEAIIYCLHGKEGSQERNQTRPHYPEL